MFKTFIALGLCLWVLPVFAGDLEPCESRQSVGSSCMAVLSSIHPTQFAVGMVEVSYKVKKLKELDEDDLAKYIRKHPAPVVIGPEGRYYLTDHHHLGLSLMKIGQGAMAVEIVGNARNLDPKDFWARMVRSNWAFLYDEKGKGPLDPAGLPDNLLALRDDPYRSLAWAVREKGGFEKSDTPFAEFKWAQFFRPRIPIELTPRGFWKAVDDAMDIVHSPEASQLPGFIPEK